MDNEKDPGKFLAALCTRFCESTSDPTFKTRALEASASLSAPTAPQP